jgi:hypothetical protein
MDAKVIVVLILKKYFDNYFSKKFHKPLKNS